MDGVAVRSHRFHDVAARLVAALWAGCIVFGLAVGADLSEDPSKISAEEQARA